MGAWPPAPARAALHLIFILGAEGGAVPWLSCQQGPWGQHCGLAVLSVLSRERGGFWSQIQASVGFWLGLLRFGLPGQQPHSPKAAEPGLLML